MKAITKLSQLDLTKQYTYADYLTWQLQERVELIKGWLVKMSPAPNVAHQSVSVNFTVLIFNAISKTTCRVFTAPFDVRLYKNSKSDSKIETVVQPDLCVVCDTKKLDDRGCLGAPELIIEIVSPGNSKKELKTKFDLYENNKVAEYWVVHPTEKYIQQFYLVKSKYQLVKIYFDDDKIQSKIFDNLLLDLKVVFKGIK